MRIDAPQELHDPENLLTYSGGIFTAKTGYSSYVWWLDGSKLTASSKTLDVKSKNLNAGAHTLMLVVMDETCSVYSATAVFVIN